MISVSSDDELWNSGQSDNDTAENTEDEDTLDLSSPSPKNIKDDEIDASPLDSTKEREKPEEDWVVPSVKPDENGISMKAIGVIGTVTILLLTGLLYILLAQQSIDIEVPNEKYDEEIVYDVNGAINFDSSLDIPLPIGFIDNDIVINELDIEFSGKLEAGINAPSSSVRDGYGKDRSVFETYLVQKLEQIDGRIQQEGENPSNLENAESLTSQIQFIEPTSLEVVRSDIESNASYSDTLTGNTWFWQGATDWVPRDSEPGLLPHGNAYIGKKLVEGDKGILSEGGIEFNWKVTNGGKVKGEQTVLLAVTSSTNSGNILGYEAQYQYRFEFYLSEKSSLPLKFKMSLKSDASSISGTLYAIDIEYNGIANTIREGYTEIPTEPYKNNINEKSGEFLPWVQGAPALGSSSCGLDSSFNLQTGIESARENITEFNTYITDQENKDDQPSSKNSERAFVIEANYTEHSNGRWNFTMAHYNEQSSSIDGWDLTYNRSDISAEEINVDNPIMSMADIPEPLTMCSSEQVMTSFDEISVWALDDKTQTVDYSKVKLSLGQNLVSKQSLSSPTSILDLGGGFDFAKIISDLSQGNLNPNDYSNNIDVNAAGSYAYFLEKSGLDNTNEKNNYQKLAGVDAKDGLVLFNLESINSNLN